MLKRVVQVLDTNAYNIQCRQKWRSRKTSNKSFHHNIHSQIIKLCKQPAQQNNLKCDDRIAYEDHYLSSNNFMIRKRLQSPHVKF